MSALRLVPLPRHIREDLVALRESILDVWDYQRAAGTDGRMAGRWAAQDRHEARLTMAYHSVEKSLSLPSPRRPFGHELRARLAQLLHDVGEREPAEDPSGYATYAADALAALDAWNHDGSMSDAVAPRLESRRQPLGFQAACSFFQSRHSVRSFDSGNPTPDDVLLQAVELARNTPSVCNRQAFRVHLYREPSQIKALLSLQNGTVGFAETITTLTVVTARRALFVGPMERNQRWIDGALFAMTLVWALHALGEATCMLNTAMAHTTCKKLRDVGGIPQGEDIVMMIAVGRPIDDARVARSSKRSVPELCVRH